MIIFFVKKKKQNEIKVISQYQKGTVLSKLSIDYDTAAFDINFLNEAELRN